MLNPKYKSYADRLRELVAEGEIVVQSATGKDVSGRPYIESAKSSDLHSWIAKVENILRNVFGEHSAHFTHYSKFAYDGKRNHLQEIGEIVPIIGILRGALDDLEKGFLLKQEFLISAALFNDVLEQAKHLCENGYKDPAAVLSRVVIENALRKIALDSGLDDKGKASVINDELKRIGRYNQPKWRMIQVWLDVGNAAAHGKFTEFTDEDVVKMISGIKGFLATEFT